MSLGQSGRTFFSTGCSNVPPNVAKKTIPKNPGIKNFRLFQIPKMPGSRDFYKIPSQKYRDWNCWSRQVLTASDSMSNLLSCSGQLKTLSFLSWCFHVFAVFLFCTIMYRNLAPSLGFGRLDWIFQHTSQGEKSNSTFQKCYLPSFSEIVVPIIMFRNNCCIEIWHSWYEGK